QKGTLAGLEDLAAEISGWGVRATEMFERLIWSQNLNHLRRHAIQAPDLADPSLVARLNTAFDDTLRTVDLRPADQRIGWHQTGNVSLFLFAIPSSPWNGADPMEAGPGRYFFHPLGANVLLYAGGDRTRACRDAPDDPATRPDICF